MPTISHKKSRRDRKCLPGCLAVQLMKLILAGHINKAVYILFLAGVQAVNVIIQLLGELADLAAADYPVLALIAQHADRGNDSCRAGAVGGGLRHALLRFLAGRRPGGGAGLH